jgi:hypothetical protein
MPVLMDLGDQLGAIVDKEIAGDYIGRTAMNPAPNG